MRQFSLALGLASLAFISSCKIRVFNSDGEANSIVKNGEQTVYVDTHDSYRVAYNGLYPDRAIEPSAVKNFSQYFKHQNKNISFTFDCAWIDDANGFAILDVLKEQGVKATFFVSGPFVLNSLSKGVTRDNLNRGKMKMIKRMIDDGHDFGNHTVNHQHNTNSAAELKNLETAWNMVVAEIYGANPPPNARMLPYYRAPYGEYTDASLRAAASAGFPYHFGWNVDVRDTTGLPNCAEKGLTGSSFNFMDSMKGPNVCESSQKMNALVLGFVKANAKQINTIPAKGPLFANFVVLAHLSNYYRWDEKNKPTQQTGLGALITQLRSEGYSFLPISGVFAFSNQAESPKPPSPNAPQQPVITDEQPTPVSLGCKVISTETNAQPTPSTELSPLITLKQGASVRASKIDAQGAWYSVSFRLGGVDYGEGFGKPAWLRASDLSCR